MPSAGSFFGLYVQRDALQIAQKALDITGNNISNINTPGYTRQRVDICSVSNSKDTVGYRTSIALAGKGSSVVGVAQIRDRTLDRDVRVYSGDLCNLGVKTNTLSDIEDIFDSIESDSGYVEASFAAIVNKLEEALQSFSSEHADRTEVAHIAMNSAQSLVQSINNSNNQIDDVAESVFVDVDKTVERINSIFTRMGNLNKEIMDAYVSMGYIQRNMSNYEVMNDYGPLELKDEMNSLIDELAQYGNVDFAEEDDGSFTIHFADQLVVFQKKYAQMAITENHPRPTELSYVITHGYTGKNELGETVVYGDLYDKDEWYDLNVKNGTGGDSQILIREYYDQLQKDVQNITGRKANGSYYLDSGTLRGYLDVYNGRGVYHDDVSGTPDSADGTYNSFQTIRKQLDLANEALQILQNPAGKTDGELKQAESDLLKSVNADVVREENGTYTVKVNNKLILDKGANLKELSYEVMEDSFGRPTGDIAIKAGDDYVRTITVNEYTGIEYYRDMLNAFSKTLHDTFNGVYKDIPVTINKADYVNTLASKLSAYNSNPAASKLTEEDIQDILAALSPTDKDGKPVEIATVSTSTNKDGFTVYTITSGGKTVLSEDGTLDLLESATSEEVEIVKSYELFKYDEDFFRNASGNIRVSDDWISDPTIISNPTKNNKYEELDNIYINKLLGVMASKHRYSDDNGHSEQDTFNIESFVSHLCDNLGKKVDEESSLYKTTDISLTLAEEARSEVMDVSMNEEGINMMNYQKWYNAIARMVTTLDEALEKLINGTGLVGLR